MEAASFTNLENGTGGFYELATELGPRHDSQPEQALAAIWTLQDIDGPYRFRSHGLEDQERVSPNLDEPGNLCGVARFSGASVVCGTTLLDGEADWATFYVPVGSLGRIELRIPPAVRTDALLLSTLAGLSYHPATGEHSPTVARQ